jgi:hypothetical protein
VISRFWSSCANVELQVGFFGNDVLSVAGMECRNCYHCEVEWVNFASYDGLETRDRGSRLYDGINASVGRRGMCLSSTDFEPAQSQSLYYAHKIWETY